MWQSRSEFPNVLTCSSPALRRYLPLSKQLAEALLREVCRELHSVGLGSAMFGQLTIAAFKRPSVSQGLRHFAATVPAIRAPAIASHAMPPYRAGTGDRPSSPPRRVRPTVSATDSMLLGNLKSPVAPATMGSDAPT